LLALIESRRRRINARSLDHKNSVGLPRRWAKPRLTQASPEDFAPLQAEFDVFIFGMPRAMGRRREVLFMRLAASHIAFCGGELSSKRAAFLFVGRNRNVGKWNHFVQLVRDIMRRVADLHSLNCWW
jgi:hypothetical protein